MGCTYLIPVLVVVRPRQLSLPKITLLSSFVRVGVLDATGLKQAIGPPLARLTAFILNDDVNENKDVSNEDE